MQPLAKKQVKRKSSQAISPVFVIGELTKKIKAKNQEVNALRSSIQKQYLIMGLLVGCTLILLAMAFQSKDKFFVVDSFGRFIQVQGYETPLVNRERRIQHAEFIVRSLNSMSFLDKDRILKRVKDYFKPEVYKGYLDEKNSTGFFTDLDARNMQYMASVEPGRLIANSGRGVKKTDAECYQDVTNADGEVERNKCSISAMELNGHSESYEFPVTRDVFANAKFVETQKFKVRITLKKSSPSEGGGYIITHYSEYL